MTGPGPGGVPAPLRLTRRGVGRLAQLALTAGTLGAAAASCGVLELRPRGAPEAAAATGAVPAPRPGPTSSPVPSGHARAATQPAGSRPAPQDTPAATTTAVPRASGLPGVGTSWAAQLTGHDQVVLVAGTAMGSVRNVVRWFDRTAGGWAQRAQTPGWNGRGGWAVRHSVGDLRTPTGVYALTDAGGYAKNPGTALPYQWNPGYYDTMINGVRTFEHVLAINYNRVAGSPPSDSRRPAGWADGGSIWVHVEHNSPTQACVGIADTALVALLRWLRPAAHPVILMGPASVLAA